jgi:hypothetical protein
MPDDVTTWQPPPTPAIPSITQIPRDPEAALVVDEVASRMVVEVTAYRQAIRSIPDDLDAAPARAAVAQAVEVRQRVALAADTITRRALSPYGVGSAQRAYRIAERAAGIVVGFVPGDFRDEFASVGEYHRCRILAEPDDVEFEQALEAAADAGDLSHAGVVNALAAGGFAVARATQVAAIGRLAAEGRTAADIGGVLSLPEGRVIALAQAEGITVRAEAPVLPPVDLDDFVPRLLAALGPLAREASRIPDVAGVDTAQAAAWAPQVWDSTAPLVALWRALYARGKGS